MRKNIWVLMVFYAMGALTLTSCSKKAVVTPKQTDRSAASAKPGVSTGSTTTTNQSPTTHTCGGNGYNTGTNPGH